MSDSINLGDSVYRALSSDKIVQRMNDEQQNQLAVGSQIDAEEKDEKISAPQDVEDKENVNNEEKNKKKEREDELKKKNKSKKKASKKRPNDGHIIDLEA